MDHGIKLGWAKDQDGIARYILEVPNGKACGCFCPAELCRRPLVARCNRPGETYQQIAHFAHEPGTACTGGALESALHLAAKRIFLDLAANKEAISLPEITTSVEICADFGWLAPVKKRYPLNHQISSARVEVMLEQVGRRPDALLVMENGDEIAIEIYVANPKTDAEVKTYEAASFAALEIGLTNIPWDISPEHLRELVVNSAERKWLFHPAIKRLQDEAEAEAKSIRVAANEQHKVKEAKRESDLRAAADWLEAVLLDWLSKGARWDLSGLEWETFSTDSPASTNGEPRPDSLNVTPRIIQTTLDRAPRPEGARVGEGRVAAQRNVKPSKTPISIFVDHWDKVGIMQAESPTLRIIVDPRPNRAPYRAEWYGIGKWHFAWKAHQQKLANDMRDEYLNQCARGSAEWMKRANEQERLAYFSEHFGTVAPPASLKIPRWNACPPVWKSMVWKEVFDNKSPGYRISLKDLQTWLDRKWGMYTWSDRDPQMRYSDLMMWLEALVRAEVLARGANPPLHPGHTILQVFILKKAKGVIPWNY